MAEIDPLTIAMAKTLFEMVFSPLKFDELDKYDLLMLLINVYSAREKLDDQIEALKNPISHMTSKRLVRLYLQSYKFTPHQKKLLKLLSDCELKTEQEINRQVFSKYKYRLRSNSGKSAFYKLISGLRSAIELSGSSDVFKIFKSKEGYRLVIDVTNLAVILKNRSKLSNK